MKKDVLIILINTHIFLRNNGDNVNRRNASYSTAYENGYNNGYHEYNDNKRKMCCNATSTFNYHKICMFPIGSPGKTDQNYQYCEGYINGFWDMHRKKCNNMYKERD